MSARRARVMAFAVMLGVAGCTSMKEYVAQDYDRGNVPADTFNRDARACEKQAESHGKEHGYGPYDPTHGAYNRMFDACMRSSGYTRKPSE